MFNGKYVARGLKINNIKKLLTLSMTEQFSKTFKGNCTTTVTVLYLAFELLFSGYYLCGPPSSVEGEVTLVCATCVWIYFHMAQMGDNREFFTGWMF